MSKHKDPKTSKYLQILTAVTVVCIIAGSAKHMFGLFSADKMREQSASLEEFDSIDLDMDLGDVQIVRGDSFSWTGEFFSKWMPELKVSGKKLTVSQSSSKSFNMKGTNKACKLVITVPEGKTIQSLSADMDLGAFSSEKVDYGDAEMVLDLGSLNLTDCTFIDLRGDVDLGSIELKNCSFEGAELNTDLGDITIDGVDHGSKYIK